MSRKICITILVDYPAIGGAERHAIFLANSLSRSEFDVCFYQIKPGGAIADQVCKDGLRAHGVGTVVRGLTTAGVKDLSRFLDETCCDVILATNPYASLYAKLASVRADRKPKVVATLHTMGYLSLKNRAQMWFYRLLYPFCDGLVYVCESQRKFWRRRGVRARRDFVIYNGVDVESFDSARFHESARSIRGQWNIPLGSKVVGVSAALRPEKAHLDLLSALQRLKREGKSVFALIVGDGPERDKIEEAVISLGLRDQVRMVGAQQDVRPFIAACDAMVLPSHTETFSLSVLESLAMGRPVVLTDVGGGAEQVQHGATGLLYPPGDTDRLAEAIAELLFEMDTELAGRAAASAVRQAFDAGQMVRHYEGVLRSSSGI